VGAVRAGEYAVVKRLAEVDATGGNNSESGIQLTLGKGAGASTPPPDIVHRRRLHL